MDSLQADFARRYFAKELFGPEINNFPEFPGVTPLEVLEFTRLSFENYLYGFTARRRRAMKDLEMYESVKARVTSEHLLCDLTFCSIDCVY